MIRCKADTLCMVRLIFVALAMFLNCWLQLVVLFYVNRFIVGQAVHDTQSHYKQYHREVFHRDGSFYPEKWKVWTGPYMELCNLAMSKIVFTLAIMFMWTARMVGELRSIERLGRDVYTVRGLKDKETFENMMVEQKDDPDDDEPSQYHVVALTKPVRASIFLTVIVPKFLIAVLLLYIGCQWLCATESFSDLILNALALEFVIAVDELMYDVFAPAVLQDWVNRVKFIHFVEAPSKDSKNAAAIHAYIRSIVYILGCCAWAYFYLFHFQQVIPSFKQDIHIHCGGWFEKHYESMCPPGMKDNSECFPFGEKPDIIRKIPSD